MKSLWLLTKKNLKLLLRAKASALIVIFAPLLIILILGLAFNTSEASGVSIGVYSTSFSDDINSLMTSLEEEGFSTEKYENSVESCIEDIKMGVRHACLELPDSFSITGNTPKEITFHLDPSRINLVWMIQETVQKKFNIKSQQISELLSGNLAAAVANAKEKVGEEKTRVNFARQKNSDALVSSESVQATLGSLNLNFESQQYGANITDTFKQNLTAKIESGILKISKAKDDLNDANLSSSIEDDIEDSLDDADSILNSAKASLESTAAFGEVEDLIRKLKDDVEIAQSRLTAASESITSGSSSISGIKTSLSESSGSLQSIETSLGELETSLGSIETTEAGVVSSPLVTKIEKINAGKTYLNYMFPALVIIVIMFSSLLLGTTLVMMEKNSPAFQRNFFLPLNKVAFIMSTYLTNLVLIVIQLVVILGISLFFLTELLPTLHFMALILFITASVFTFLGMAIGYAFTSEETGVLASISTGSLLLFVSGVILPLESMAPLLREITSYNPFVIAEKLVREVFIFGTSFSTYWIDFLILTGYAVVLFLVILIIESLFHQHLRQRFMRHHHKKHKAEQKEKRGA